MIEVEVVGTGIKTVKGAQSADRLKERELGSDVPELTRGIALSGGGIRSASFAVGVVQALLIHLRRKGHSALGERYQYLSTVSGGGYFGATLTWLQQIGLNLDEELDSVTGGHRTRTNRNWLDYVRQHGNYLQPNSVSTLSLISVVLRNVLVSLFVYFLLAVALFSFANSSEWLQELNVGEPVAFWTIPGFFVLAVFSYLLFVLAYPIATYIGSFQPFFRSNPTKSGMQPVLGSIWILSLIWIGHQAFGDLPDYGLSRLRPNGIDADFLITAAYFLVLLISLISLVRALWADHNGQTIPSSNYRNRLVLQRHAGKLLGFILLTGTVTLIPSVYRYIDGLIEAATASGVASVLGVVGAIYQFAIGRDSSTSSGMLAKLRILVTAAILIFGLLLGAYTVALRFEPFLESYLLVLSATLLVFGFLVNTNYFGISRMYRDRLMETFLPDTESIKDGQWYRAEMADTSPISGMAAIRPYHLVNTNVVLVDSSQDYYKGRGGDSFVIAPDRSGSDATGYVDTKLWLKNRMNLPTAIAISGAAINPNTGVGGSGITRNRLVSFLLSLLQLRIGYWAPNVKFIKSSTKARSAPTKRLISRLLRPNYWVPGLFQGLFGRGLHEEASWIELTDGGHFDNTGVYELIRRELGLIVMTLASADPNYYRTDLANLIRKVRVDFGAHILFNPIDLERTIPKNSSNRPNRGYLVGDIEYASGTKGRIVAIMATPIEELTPEVVSYLRSHPDFPNESTGDQFYDEEQFEAYRELGFLIASDAIKNSDVL